MFFPFWTTVLDLHSQRDLLRRRRFGVIEMQAGRFSRIVVRPLPKLVSNWETKWLGARYHRRAVGDRCWLYYNQPWGSPNYLSLQYFVSSSDCSLASFQGALAVLDWLAQLKNSAAIVCHGNDLFSERLFRRWGWEQHLLDYPGRHYIKRFYGDFSAVRSVERYLTSA